MNTNQNTIQLTSIGNPQISGDLVKIKKISKRSVSKFLLVNLIGLLIFLIGATISLISYQSAYAEKVAPNVYIASKSISGLNKDSLNAQLTQLARQFEDKQITFQISKDKSVKATYKESGIKLDTTATFASIWEVGHSENLLTIANDLLSGSINPGNLKYSIQVNETTLSDFLSKKLNSQLPVAIDAKMVYENNTLTITGSSNGLTIDKTKTVADLTNNAKNGEFDKFYISTKTTTPNLKKADVGQMKQKIENLLNQSFVLSAGIKSLKVSSEDLFKMLTFKTVKNELVTEVNATELENYLIANERYLVVTKIDKQIVAGSNMVIREGVNGQKIDRTEARELLNKAISDSLAGKSVSTTLAVSTVEEQFGEQIIDPSELTSASAFSAAMPTGKSIVVDISEQRLSAFENGQLVNSFLVSTGVPSHETPRGTFTIFRRIYSVWYRGYNNDGTYWSYPNTLYNMEFKSSYLLHGAYWHNNFGRKMSHGCVNIAYVNAEWLWNWSEIGTPVITQN